MKQRATTFFALCLGLLLLSPGAVAQVQQVSGVACVAGRQSPANCTANDQDQITAAISNVESPCIAGSAVVDLMITLPSSNANTRYDVGVAVAEDGDDAINGSSCTVGVAVAGDPGTVDSDSDYCQDRGANSELSYDLQDVTIACPPIGEPVLVGICTMWKQNGADDCGTANDAAPGSPSKCDCTAAEVGTSPLPVELTSFTGEVDRGAVTLRWRTASEKNNAGFAVEHAYRSAFREVGFVTGRGTTLEESRYSYALDGLNPGKHRFRLKQVDYDGAHRYSSELELTVGVPGKFVLEQAYPNPFNPSTTINFLVPEEQQVTMELYTILGLHVKTLHAGVAEANTTQTVQVDAEGLPSGVYVVRLNGQNFTASQQIVLMK